MHTHRTQRLVQLGAGTLIQVDIGKKAARIAADDGQHQAQILPHNAHHRFGAAADADPNRHALRAQGWLNTRTL